jgi:hypothetical protein
MGENAMIAIQVTDITIRFRMFIGLRYREVRHSLTYEEPAGEG